MPPIQISTADGIADAHLAIPPGGRGPGVLLWIDAIGLRPQIVAMAHRIAAWGYVVLAPNVFYRAGTAEELAPSGDLRDPAQREAFMPEIHARVAALGTASFLRDLEAYVETLSEHADVPFGITGYCLGARLAIRTAAAYPALITAAAGFHGGGIVTGAEDSPHLDLARASAEFVFGHAADDRGMTPENVAELGRALADAGLVATNEIYLGAHGYTMSDTAPYDEASAERSFTAIRNLFGRRLGTVAGP